MPTYAVTAHGCVMPPLPPEDHRFLMRAASFQEALVKVATYLSTEQIPFDRVAGTR